MCQYEIVHGENNCWHEKLISANKAQMTWQKTRISAKSKCQHNQLFTIPHTLVPNHHPHTPKHTDMCTNTHTNHICTSTIWYA